MKDAAEIIKHFSVKGDIADIKSLNSGHINTTFRVAVVDEGVKKYYTVQAINTYVFTNPEGVMNNIVGVTEHIRKKLAASGGNVERGVLTVVPAVDGKYFYVDEENTYWRVYRFIDKSHTQNKVENPQTLF